MRHKHVLLAAAIAAACLSASNAQAARCSAKSIEDRAFCVGRVFNAANEGIVHCRSAHQAPQPRWRILLRRCVHGVAVQRRQGVAQCRRICSPIPSAPRR